jgi:hypothetical protein
LNHVDAFGIELGSVGYEAIKRAHDSAISQGDAVKTAMLLAQQAHADAVVIRAPGSTANVVGAVNVDAVSCWLDSLLFAMYATMDSYDGLLMGDPSRSHAQRNVVRKMTLWVNMLRSGHLVTADVVSWFFCHDELGTCRLETDNMCFLPQTSDLLDCLIETGWDQLRPPRRQQDPSEGFVHITEF